MSDALPAEVTYAGSGLGDMDSVSYDAPTRTVSAALASLAPGASASFTIRATLD